MKHDADIRHDERLADTAASWDIPPWQLPGTLRRDCQTHRGPLLRRLANIARICFIGTQFGWPIVLIEFRRYRWLFSEVFLVTIGIALLGALLGLTTWVLARSDLADMKIGLIDREGECETEFALERAVWSFALGIVSIVFWGGWYILLILRIV